MITLAVERRVQRLIAAYGLHADWPVPVASIAEQIGWTVNYRERIYPLFGYAIVSGPARVMTINADICPAWQRFAIAHELGHWLAGHLGNTLTGAMDELPALPPPNPAEEDEATLIAALLLVPEATLLGTDTAASVALACDVPVELVYQRLDF